MVQTYDYLEARLINLEKSVESMKQTVENFIETLPTELDKLISTKLELFRLKHDKSIVANVEGNDDDVLSTRDKVSEDEKKNNNEMDKLNKENYAEKESNMVGMVEEMVLRMDTVEEINSIVVEINNKIDTVAQKINSDPTSQTEPDALTGKIQNQLAAISEKLDTSKINAKLAQQEEIIKKLQADSTNTKISLKQLESHFTHWNKEFAELRRLMTTIAPVQSKPEMFKRNVREEKNNTRMEEKHGNGCYSNWDPELTKDRYFVPVKELCTLLEGHDINAIEKTLKERTFKNATTVNKYMRFPISGVYIDMDNLESQIMLKHSLDFARSAFYSPLYVMMNLRKEYFSSFYSLFKGADNGGHIYLPKVHREVGHTYGVYDLKAFETEMSLKWTR